MRYLVLVTVAVVIASAVARRRRARVKSSSTTTRRTLELPFVRGSVGIVAAREIRERLRGRMFRVGTLLLLVVVAAAIIIPSLHHGHTSTLRVGVVGALPVNQRAQITRDVHLSGDLATFTTAQTLARASAQLRKGQVDLVIVNDQRVVVDTFATSPQAAVIAQIAQDLGVARALARAQLSPGQLSILEHASGVPITSLHHAHVKPADVGTSIVGLILIFMMLQQYNTWTLIGVMEEKSSRVIEVLLATLRPIQLLTGKVLGIGIIAFAQATLVVGFALMLAKSVGSSLLHGAAPLELVSILAWLLLGYTFYSWVYAAAGSMTERQDQIQAVALPLSVPLIVGYIVSLAAAESGHASLFVRVLAYLPPTAPLAMPALVGLSAVTWWAFAISVAISLLATYGVARFAARVYQRAILRTGARVPLRDALALRPRHRAT